MSANDTSGNSGCYLCISGYGFLNRNQNTNQDEEHNPRKSDRDM